jgi:hypothetical protein
VPFQNTCSLKVRRKSRSGGRSTFEAGKLYYDRKPL